MLASGFTAAPVSKYLFFGIIASSILVSITDTKYLFDIQVVPHLWRYKQVWRVLVWQCCYTNSASLLFAAMTIYQLRVIERLWGSRKFAVGLVLILDIPSNLLPLQSFLLATFPPTLLIPPIILALILRPLSLNSINSLPAGPTSLIYALLAQYYAAIPTIYKYRLVTSPAEQHGFVLSDKFLNYLVAGELAFSSLPGSLITATVGWGVGVAWRGEFGPGGWVAWRLPGWMSGDSGRGRDGFDGLRRRLEGEARGAENAVEAEGGAMRT